MIYTLSITSNVSLGITANERQTPQPVSICMRFEYDCQQAFSSDAIEDTIDYQQIYEHLERLLSKKDWNLLETLHHDIHNSFLVPFPEIKIISLEVTKTPWKNGNITIS